MKKMIFPILLLVAGMTLFSSCEKDFVCECTTTDPNGNVLSTTTEIITGTRNEAKSTCDDGEGELVGFNTECELQ